MNADHPRGRRSKRAGELGELVTARAPDTRAGGPTERASADIPSPIVAKKSGPDSSSGRGGERRGAARAALTDGTATLFEPDAMEPKHPMALADIDGDTAAEVVSSSQSDDRGSKMCGGGKR
jgi:hypothetical protein